MVYPKKILIFSKIDKCVVRRVVRRGVPLYSWSGIICRPKLGKLLK